MKIRQERLPLNKINKNMDFNGFQERYVNPYTDFGFKKLFGSEVNKDLLISFLNALLHEEQQIVDITYLPNEHIGEFELDRKSIFDVYCQNDKGEHFIVEMQKAEQKFFKDRSVFYATFPIREQAKRGEWDYSLKAVYTVGILNFVFDEDKDSQEYFHHEVKLMDTYRKTVFYDKLTFIYLEMPKFNKQENELDNLFDKWMFVLKNLSRLTERPAALQERIFERVFRAAEIARLDKKDLAAYEESLKIFRDLNNVISTAEWKGEAKGHAKGLAEGLAKGLAQGLEEGHAKGLEEGRLEMARKMKAEGIPFDTIRKISGLDLPDIQNL